MIRPIGPRVLVRPLESPPSTVIELTDKQPPQIAEVLAIGHARCPACDDRLPLSLSVGMRVALNPYALVDEVTVSGQTLWMVLMDDVIGEIERMHV